MTISSKLLLLLCVLSVCAGCASHGEEALPEFVLDLIADDESGRSLGGVNEIWRSVSKGKSFYYVVPHCCDFPIMLYDQQGNFLCSPSGGLSGSGDGKCSDFLLDLSEGILVWKDKRESTSQ